MKQRLLPALILFAYCIVLFKVMVLKDIPVIRIGALMLNFGGTQEGPPNFIPFRTILPYLLGEKGFIIAGLNIGGNILLLVPVGFLIPFIYRDITWKKSLALALAAGLAIEAMQVILHVGIFDIDDVILNGLGVMFGFWVFAILSKMERSTRIKTILFTSLIVIAAGAAFYLLSMTHPHRPRRDVRPIGDTTQSNGVDTMKSDMPEADDPCGGTGGTGEIVKLGNNSITIKRNDGVNEIINLTEKTIIKNSLASLTQSDLKIGYRVTVVVMSNHTATTVLVCNGQNSGVQK